MRVLNPLRLDDVMLLGEMCGLEPGMRQLDLASGKGEMLCQYAARHGITGLGVDIYTPFVADARARAIELGVERQVEFVLADAATHDPGPDQFDVVSCIGATWIGGGLAGTIDIMRP